MFKYLGNGLFIGITEQLEDLRVPDFLGLQIHLGMGMVWNFEFLGISGFPLRLTA
jgi:hypothetical protein